MAVQRCLPAANCSNPLGPTQANPDIPELSGLNPDTAAGISAAFEIYFDGIDSGDYAAAYAILDPRNHPASGEPSFADGDSTSSIPISACWPRRNGR